MRIISFIACCILFSINGSAQEVPYESDTCKVFLPSAFTPNSDGFNDRLNILSMCDIDAAVLEVYNRWGSLIYTTTSKNEGWDGIGMNGEKQPGGMYIWIVKYSRAEEENIVKGTVALLR